MSTKNDIYSNLKIQLERITNDNGYESDIGLVRLGPLYPDEEYAKLPAIGITGDAEELLIPGTTNNRYSTALILSLMVKNNNDVGQQLSAIITNIKSLIYDSIETALGDNALKLFYVSTDAGIIEQSGIGTATMNLELIWWDTR